MAPGTHSMVLRHRQLIPYDLADAFRASAVTRVADRIVWRREFTLNFPPPAFHAALGPFADFSALRCSFVRGHTGHWIGRRTEILEQDSPAQECAKCLK